MKITLDFKKDNSASSYLILSYIKYINKSRNCTQENYTLKHKSVPKCCMLFKRDRKVEKKGQDGTFLGCNKTGRKGWDGTVHMGTVKIPTPIDFTHHLVANPLTHQT